MSKLAGLYHFSRPHTVGATSLQVLGIFAVIVVGQSPSTSAALVLVLTWLGSLATNLYVVGLNQITDVAIDMVNKPKLPLASGVFSQREAVIIVVVSGVVAIAIGVGQDMILLLTFLLVMAIGTVYSLKPIRLKLRPFWAAFSIALARGVIANLGLAGHYVLALNVDTQNLPIRLAWLLLFFFGFGMVIALYKDIPDWAGDREFSVRTYAVRLGRVRVFRLGRWILTAIYTLPILLGLSLLPAPTGAVLALSHVVALALFWGFSLRTDPGQPASMTRLYLFLWALFYAEYVFLILYGSSAA